MSKKPSVRDLPSVDEVLKSPFAKDWLEKHPRRYIIQSVRETIEEARKRILSGAETDIALSAMAGKILERIQKLSAMSLRRVINATGIVIHTNLGRSVLPESAILNMTEAASGYSTLEYDIDKGRRGSRHTHLRRLLKDATGAEDGVAVNNNAGAVLIALSALAKGREVIVSRGELVEIGGSFRIPDVMASGGAILREVGTTNKTHALDYEKAINENTALILKVHQSNYRIIGFTEDVSIADLKQIGKRHNIPVMLDLGSGSLVDLKPLGIHGEPTVQETVSMGADIVTFSGDKLLGGPQAGLIVGKSEFIGAIQKNPLMRALRMDKVAIAALEAVLMEYADMEKAKENIPTLRMLFETQAEIKKRAAKLVKLLNETKANPEVIEDFSQAGGGSLPEVNLPTYAVSLNPKGLSPNKLEERLRLGHPPVIARIKDDRVILDMRTVQDGQLKELSSAIEAATERD